MGPKEGLRNRRREKEVLRKVLLRLCQVWCQQKTTADDPILKAIVSLCQEVHKAVVPRTVGYNTITGEFKYVRNISILQEKDFIHRLRRVEGIRPV